MYFYTKQDSIDKLSRIEEINLSQKSIPTQEPDIKKSANLTYKISNGVVSIAGDMPVLEEGNPLKGEYDGGSVGG